MDAGTKIKEFRLNQNPTLSQAGFGRLVDVSRFTVLRWERTGKIGEEKLPEVSRVLGVPAKELRPDLIESYKAIFGDAS